MLWLPREVSAQSLKFQRADGNADGKVNIGDPIYELEFLFRGGPAPACWKAADANDDGSLDISDPVYTLLFLFCGGEALPGPFPGCGLDPTEDELPCAAFAPCADRPVYVNIQVDAELDDTAGLNRMIDILYARKIPASVYVTADYANRNALLISGIFSKGFEIALHGYYTGEQLASMTYAEQKDLLTRAMHALEGCKPCGTYKPVVGFRPQYFSQNEDTYRVLDELALRHNSGFKARELYLPGFAWAEAPYPAPGHDFMAAPLATVVRGEKRVYLCDIACAQVLLWTGDQWREALLEKLAEALETRMPVAVLFHNWYTGDTEKYTYWQPFVDFLDAARAAGVTFVTTDQLCSAHRGN
ncbi:MAG: polysaccharide deacetylase family protein [Planctomycetota bacterium]